MLNSCIFYSKKIPSHDFFIVGTNGVRMIKEVRFSDNKINFRQSAVTKKPEKDEESELLPNTLKTRVLQKTDKTMNAIIEYPYKGLKGDVNSDFYEFLSMGIIPYLAGSAMFMLMFNLLNKHLTPKAALNGKKMGLGVVLYGLGKTLSNDLVTRPVYWSTGVDVELPYKNIYCTLPTKPGAEADVDHKHQQRKVYDSIEFFRKDLIAKHPDYGVPYYDGIAKKIGLGDNLNDSVTETTPIIQSIVASTKTAKSLSSYAWAAAGVCVAAQDCWADFFKAFSERPKYFAKDGEGFFSRFGGKLVNTGKNTYNLTKTFGKTFGRACKSLWTSGIPGSKGFMKHAGKAWLLFTAALTAGTTANVIYRAKHMGKLANKDLIDRTEESTVI